MPELPDVEYLRQYAEATSLHRTIVGSSLASERLLDETSAQLVARRLKGASFQSARRHGKHLFLELEASGNDPGALMLHFGMTGALEYEQGDGAPEYRQLSIEFEDGSSLFYTNKRMLGAIAIIDDPDTYVADHGLGPDALSVSEETLDEVIHGGRGAVKSTLMNQSRLAGLGNIYTDEILFHARIDPRRPCSELSADEVATIHAKIRHVCSRAIEAHARPDRMPESWLIRRRDDGARCPRCGGRVQNITLSGRSTYLCEGCQR
ncbi:MAG: Fpg/Nei family DNA glycosylase [Spirochaetota bacterium]